jgi:Fe-S-cluster containining protein
MSAPARERNVHCDRCDALCCRLTVVVFDEDAIPEHLVEHDAQGLRVMARDADGWCVALDGSTFRCSIYTTRPTICRKFAMAGPYCLEVRAEARQAARALPITLLR